MLISRLALVFTTASLFFSFGCGTKTADCNKAIEVFNNNAAELKKVDMKKDDGMLAAAAVLDKSAASYTALAQKDEGAKAKTMAMAESDKAMADSFRKTAAMIKQVTELSAKPMPEGVDAMNKHVADLKALTDKMEADKSIDEATAKDKAASAAFDTYCEATTK